MRAFLIVLAGIAGLAIATLLAIVFLFPKNEIRTQVERGVEAATGRQVAIEGPIRVLIYPNLGVEARKVRLANVPGGMAKSLLEMESVALGVELLPLIRGDVRVKRLELNQPKLALEVDAMGHPNWLLAPIAPQDPSKAPQIKALSLGDVRIVNGQITFASQQDKTQLDISKIDIAASLANLDSPLSLKGGFTYRGERAGSELRFAAPRAFLQQGRTPIQLTLSEGPALGALDGVLDTKTGQIDGAVNLKGESFRRLSAWAGAPMGPGPGFLPFAIDGDLSIANGAVRLRGADLELDAIRGKGDLALLSSGPRPKLMASLDVNALDLNTYATSTEAKRGVDVQSGWSAAPMDFSGLKGFDAEMSLRTGALTFQKMHMERAALDLSMVDGLLDARLKDMSLYGGHGSGRLVLDARGAVPKVRQSLNVTGIEALPFLGDAIGMDRLAGKANLIIDVAGEGRSQEALMKSLRGAFSMQLANGEIKGFSLGEIARTVRAALSGGALGPAASTDFGAFSANFLIKDGVAASNDISLTAPFLRMSGAGLINLGTQTADLRVTPRAVSSVEGQGSTAGGAGLGVPFVVKGPWAKLQFSPDLAGAAQALLQQQVQAALQGGQGIGDLVGGLLGTKPKPAPEAPADPNRPPAQTRSPLDDLLDAVRKPK